MTKIVVGITGGIASGKTYVSDILGDQGFDVVDADLVARQVVKKGSKTLNKLVRKFGAQILKDDGALNRRVLKEIAFKDSIKTSQLNAIVHPAVKIEIENQINKSEAKIILLVIPLLNQQMANEYLMNRILLIDVNEETQLARLTKRDGIDEKLAKNIIKSQPSRLERMTIATDIINNNGSIQSLNKSVDLVNRLFSKIV